MNSMERTISRDYPLLFTENPTSYCVFYSPDDILILLVQSVIRLRVMEELLDQIIEGKIAYEKGSLDFSVGEVSLSIHRRDR